MAQFGKCSSLHLGSGHDLRVWALGCLGFSLSLSLCTLHQDRQTERKGRQGWQKGRREGRKKKREISFVPKG